MFTPPPLFFRNWRSFCSTWRRTMLRWVHANTWLNVAECCWLNRQLGAGGTQMSQSVNPNLNMTSAASLAVWSRLTQSASYLTFTNTEVNTCAADYSSNILKYYPKFCCKVHWNTMIVTYTSVNLHLEHYTLYDSATQRTNVCAIVHEKTWWQASWILKSEPKASCLPSSGRVL